MSFSRDLSSFLFRRSLVVLVVSAVVLSGCSGGGDEPAEVSKTVEVPADTDGGDAGADGEAVGEDAPIPFDEFDPEAYEVGDVVPEVEIVKPVEYPEMANNDEAGAKAAAQYMIDVLNYTYNTGDFTYLDGVSHKRCDVCRDTEEHISTIYDAGAKPIGPVLRNAKISVFNEGEYGWVLDVKIDYVTTPCVDSESKIIGHIQNEGVQESQMVLFYDDGDKWQISALGEAAFNK